MASDAWVHIGRDAAMDMDLSLFVAGEPARVGPPTHPPSGRRILLEGQTSAREVSWGWSGRLVFRTDDGGTSWRRVGETAGSIDRLVAINGSQVLARSGERLYRSEDGGRSWTESTTIDTRADWARVSGETPKLGAQESLDCTLQGPSRISVAFGVQGCFGGSNDSLTLDVRADGSGTLKGSVTEWDPKAKQNMARSVERNLTREEARNAIQGLASATTRLESPSGCFSTTRTFAALTWTCGSAAPSTLSFETNDCGAPQLEVVGGETRAGAANIFGFARAIGVKTEATALLTTDAANPQRTP